MKRLISLVLLLTILLGVLAAAPASATTTSVQSNSPSGLREKYDEYSPALWKAQARDIGWVYTTFANNAGYSKWDHFLATLAGEELCKERYVEILVNLMSLMEYNTQDMIDRQVEADTTKTFGDYAMDAANLVVEGVSLYSVFGSGITSTMDSLATAMNITWSGAETLIKDLNQFQYFSRTYNSYVEHKRFLTTIVENTNNEDLKSAAVSLLGVLDNTLYTRIEIVASQGTVAAEFLGKDVFFDTYVMDFVLSDKTIVKLSEEEKLYAGLLKKIYGFLGALEFGKDAGVFVADMLGGASDTYNRYTEIIAMNDIRAALISQGSTYMTQIANTGSDEDVLNFCAVARDLVYVNHRGEYCVSEMLRDEGGLFGLIRRKEKDANADEVINSAKELTENSVELIEKIETGAGYTWLVEPTIEAEDISITQFLDKRWQSDLAIIKRDGKYGLIDYNGKLLFKCEASGATVAGCGLVCLNAGPAEQVVTIDDNGSPVLVYHAHGCGLPIQYIYENETLVPWGYNAGDPTDGVIVAKDSSSGKYAVFNNGEQVTEFVYDDGENFWANDGVAVCLNNKWGYFNSEGVQILPCEYVEFERPTGHGTASYVCSFSGNLLAVRNASGGGYYNSSGECVIPCGEFEDVRSVQDGKAWVKENGKWGVISIYQYENVYKTEFSHLVDDKQNQTPYVGDATSD